MSSIAQAYRKFFRPRAVRSARLAKSGVEDKRCDLKPQNIMLVPDPETQVGERVKILDFGIAKFLDTSGPEQQFLTNTSALLGTPMYMSPEQCRNAREVTDRSDIYSLGILAYQLFSGAQPFRGGTDMEIILEHATATPMPIREFEPSVPLEIDQMVLAMLSRQAIERPSARDVLQVLAGLLKSHSMSSGAIPIVENPLNANSRSGNSFDGLAPVRASRPQVLSSLADLSEDEDDDDGTAPTRDAPLAAPPNAKSAAPALEQTALAAPELEQTAIAPQHEKTVAAEPELEKTAIASPELERTAIAPPGLADSASRIRPPPGFDLMSTVPLSRIPMPNINAAATIRHKSLPIPARAPQSRKIIATLVIIALVIAGAAVTLLFLLGFRL